MDFLRRRNNAKHERTTAMLSAYVDGELEAEDRQRVEAHVAQCDACAEELRTLRYAKNVLARAPIPRIPRSFVIRRADLETTAPRRLFGLSTRLAYGYLKGATALVTVVFALAVAGDLIAQLSFGRGELALAPGAQATVVDKVVEVEKAVQVEKEVVVQDTEEMEQSYQETPTLVVEGTPEMEMPAEKIVTPAPVERSALPTASPPVPGTEPSIQALAVPEPATTQEAVTGDLPPKEAVSVESVEESSKAGETFTPLPMPTATPPPSPVPSATPEPAVTTVVREREDTGGLTGFRIAEIGLGAAVLILLVATLVVRRQQSS